MKKQSSAWYVDFFSNDYLHVYSYLFTTARAEKEVAFVASALELTPNAHLLDLCCGVGRHSVLLAQRGFQVTALDLNASYLESARHAANAASTSIETIIADMREIPFENYFDAVINMYSSFGYLESEAEDARVLQSIAKSSKPNGRLLLDMLNREWAVANYIQNDWHAGDDGTLYIKRRDLDLATSRMHVRFTIIAPSGNRRESVGHNIRLYTLTEATGLLEGAGLRVTAVFGGFGGESYTIDSRRMIICAQKS